VIWFLVLDEALYAAARMRDLVAISKRNHQVTCIFPVLRNTPEFRQENLKIETVRVGRLLPIVSYLRFCLMGLRAIFKHNRNPDAVVLGANLLPLAFPWLLLRMFRHKNRPVLAVRETSPPVEVHSTRRYYQPIFRSLSLRLFSPLCDAIFAISPLHAQRIVAEFKVPPRRVHVWPSSVDTDLFSSQIHSNGGYMLRKKLKAEHKFLLIYHGTLSDERGLYELIEAVRRVHEKGERVLLLLLGKGKAEPRLKEQIRSYGLNDIVLLHGPVAYADVPKFIAAADAGIVPLPDHPQWRYQTPTKVLEYLAMRKPVIITDIGAHRLIVGDQPAVFSCGGGSPSEIATAIEQCIHARENAEEINRDQIVKYSPDAIADDLLKTFDDLMHSWRRRTVG